MSSGDTRTLIQEAVERFAQEVPALQQLKSWSHRWLD